MSRSRWIYGLAALAVVLVVWLWLFPPRWWLNYTKEVDLTDAVGTGTALVETYECRNCHKIGDEGLTKGPSLVGVTGRLDTVSLRLWLRDPRAIIWRTSMPNFQLSDSEIEAIVAYLTVLDNNNGS